MLRRFMLLLVVMLSAVTVSAVAVGVGSDLVTNCDDGHTYGVGTLIKDATCTEDGQIAYTCTVCGEEKVDTISALGHDMAVVAGSRVEPSCTEDGYAGDTECTRSGCTYVVEGAVIPATGHTNGTAVKENEIKPTCTTAGSYDSVVYCTVDGCEIEVSRTTIDVDPLGHDVEFIAGTAATCVATGTKDHYHCEVCSKNFEDSDAQNELTNLTIAIDATNHTDLVTVLGYAASCKQDGLTDGQKCDDCGVTTVAQEPIPMVGCVDTNPQDGTCDVCGDPMCEHEEEKLTSVVTNPTCTADGYTTYTCECEYSWVVVDEGSKLGHDYGTIIPQVDATCTKDGKEAYYDCSRCDCIFDADKVEVTEDDLIIKAEHNLTPVEEVAATCVATGTMAHYHCAGCQKNYTDATARTEILDLTIAIDEDAHPTASIETIPGYSANCTEAGLTDGTKCTLCNTTITEQETIPAVGHIGSTQTVNHCANCEHTFSVDEIIAMAKALAEGKSLTGKFQLSGIILSKSGDFIDLKVDGSSEEYVIDCYKTKDSANLVMNDVITVSGTIKNYRGTIEFDGADLINVSHTIKIEESENGTVTANVSDSIVAPGTTVTFTVTPANGYELNKFVVNGSSVAIQDNTYTVDVTASLTISATFKVIGSEGTEVSAPYSYEFTAQQYSANGTVALGNISWTVTADSTFFGWDTYNNKGHQFGSGSNPNTTLTIVSDEIITNIGVVKITTAGASSTNAKLIVKVNGVQIGEEISLTSSTTEYTFEANSNNRGIVEFIYTQTSSKALYVKAIAIDKLDTCEHANTEERVESPATCVDAGITAGTYCLDCEKYISGGEEIPATGEHNYVDGNCTGCGAEEPSQGGDEPVVGGTKNASIDFSQQEYTNAQEIASAVIDEDITIAFNKGTNSNTPKYYTDGTAIRVYGGGYFTISGENLTITNITLTYGTSDKTNTITTDVGTFTTDTWTGNAKAVKFTVGGTSGHRRIKTIEVTYVVTGTQEPACEHTNTSVTKAAQASTCTVAGWTQEVTCFDCGEVVTESEALELDANAHAYDDGVVTTAATCSAEGVKTFTCAHNNAHTYTEEVAIDEDAHAYDEGVVTTAATCSAEGVKTFTCAHNNAHTYTEEVAIDEDAHAYDAGVITTAATCSAEGVKTFTCAHNNAHTYTEEVAIDEDAHAYDEGVVTTAATCSAEGVKTFTCAHNNAHTYTEEVAIDEDAHAYDAGVITTPATCTTVGEKTFTCAHNDEHTYTVEVEIDEEAHQWNDGVVTTEPTCTTEGEKTFTCAHNGEHTKKEVVSANGHDDTELVDGRCDICGVSLCAEHAYDAGVVTTAATCMSSGVKTLTCQTCGDIKIEEIAIDEDAHAYDAGVVTTAATCSAKGVKTFTCSHNDEHTYTEEVEIDATAHQWNAGVVTTDPTCSAEGVKTFTCAHNGEHTKTESVAIDEDAHAYDTGVITTPATCTTVGEKTFTCAHNDEHTYTVEVEIDEEAHQWNDGVVTTEPTCSAEGVKTFTCAHNGEHTKTEIVAIDEDAHAYDDGVVTTPATCTTVGEKTFTCAHNDAHTYTEEVAIDEDAHAYDAGVITTPATCTTVGEKTFTCAHNEEHTYTVEVAIDEDAHAYDAGVITTPATCTTVGEKTYTCQDNNEHTKTEAIPATGHTFVDGKCVCGATKATLTFDANKENRVSYSTSQQVWSQNGITFTNNKASSTSNVADYGNPVRLYKNSTITIDMAKMLSISFTTTGGDYLTALQSSISDKTVSGNIVTITFAEATDSITITLSGGQVRLNSIEVIYMACSHTNTEEIPAVAATCNKTGLTAGEKCSDCGEILTAQEEVPMVEDCVDEDSDNKCDWCGSSMSCEHDYSGELTEVSDTQHSVKCLYCDSTELENHVTTTTTVNATCTAKGSTTTSCECGYSVTTEIPMTDHNYVSGTCSVCGATQNDASWKKATSIAVGDTVTLVCEAKKMELSGGMNSSTKYGTGVAYTTTPVGAYELTIVEGYTSGTYAFKTSGGQYLYWQSGNYLQTNGTLSANTSWTVTFDAKGNAIIKNCQDSSRQIQWNASSPRFSAYTSSQTAIQIYKFA